MTTAAPSAARPLAIPAPMPFDAPVTTAVLPDNLFMTSSSKVHVTSIIVQLSNLGRPARQAFQGHDERRHAGFLTDMISSERPMSWTLCRPTGISCVHAALAGPRAPD